ncbi:DEAD/DEAH box helicase family protein [Globicatella sanguinis]
MFNMATGSGKTDIMAGLILFLFKEKGYQNFLFTVNTNGVLTKTIDNLTNVNSIKFLFNSPLEIEGERISIHKVEGKFPDYPNKNDINIRFVSIQTLTNELYTKSENVMSLKEYEKKKMIIIADEAHHYSASTKKKKKTKTEEEKATWENSLKDLLNAHSENLLLEFTATLDFEDETIYQKYRDKIIYRYNLDSFIRDKYSKNVRRIQTGNSNQDNMLSTVLLSEYRKIFALENFNVEIKPIILFKSQKIDASYEAHRLFNEIIDNLTTESLRLFLENQIKSVTDEQSQTLQLAYQYYLEKDDLSSIVREIKRSFSQNRIINANDTDSSKKGLLETGNYQALNSLESPDNLYRVIFAVAKLTEGWDVLNLYDIVRISGLGKTEDKKDVKSTNSEAQLIGRGARYNPFVMQNKISYTRRFDEGDEGDEIASLLLETLHYHTINDTQYINNLMKSLEKMNLASENDKKNPPLDIKLKKSFKQTNIFSEGKLYYNTTEIIPDSHYTNFRSYGIDIAKIATIPYFKSTIETGYQCIKTAETKTMKLHNIDKRYFQKAINRSQFFKFNNLIKYLPNLKSMNDFWGKDWLDLEHLHLEVVTEKETDDAQLTPNEKLKIVSRFFDVLASRIKLGYQKERGTNQFVGFEISEYLVDYKKRVPQYDTSKKTMEQIVSNVDFKTLNFFAYESAVINKNEENLVYAIASHIDELKDKYEDVFLIRMDENMHRGNEKSKILKLHQFEKTPREFNCAGFQPDFLLILQNQEFYLQIYIEPKGEHLIETEKWKEEILTYINEHQDEIVFENDTDEVVIKGVKFYNQQNKEEVLNQLAEITLAKPQFKGNINLNLF